MVTYEIFEDGKIKLYNDIDLYYAITKNVIYEGVGSTYSFVHTMIRSYKGKEVTWQSPDYDYYVALNRSNKLSKLGIE